MANVKVSPQQVKNIKAELSRNPRPTQAAVAKKHGLKRSTISDIATERIHKSVPWPSDPPVNKSGGQRKRKGDENYNPTDERVVELEAEVLHLRDDLRTQKQRATTNVKTQGLLKAAADLLVGALPAISPLPPRWELPKKTATVHTEHLVMHLSDGHHDQIVRPAECNNVEQYDFHISCCRGEQYIDTVLKWTKQTMSCSHYFPSLTVLAYGDHTSGEIHGAVGRSQFKNQFKNCMAIGKLHAMMYRDLAQHFEQVNCVYVPGNHGRRSMKKDFHGAHDNWDYLIAEMAKEYCRDLNNVAFLIPDAFSINLDINGVGFNICHGDDVKGALGIPYYGLQRRQRSLIALGHLETGPRTRYFCCGHFHKPGSVGDMDGEMLVNGPWVATDSYCYNSFGGYTEPSQWIHGVHPKHGITWRMDVKLRDREREAHGPQRYKIEL